MSGGWMGEWMDGQNLKTVIKKKEKKTVWKGRFVTTNEINSNSLEAST